MNIYVWREFCPDYSDGLAVAIADSVEQAKELVTKDYDFEPYNWGPVQAYPLHHVAFTVAGGA